MQALLRDFGILQDIALVIHTDSSAAKGTSDRLGLGKLKHVRTRYLWVQERVANRDISIVKIGTHSNFADILTKAVSRNVIDTHMRTIGQCKRPGRAEAAHQLIRS